MGGRRRRAAATPAAMIADAGTAPLQSRTATSARIAASRSVSTTSSLPCDRHDRATRNSAWSFTSASALTPRSGLSVGGHSIVPAKRPGSVQAPATARLAPVTRCRTAALPSRPMAALAIHVGATSSKTLAASRSQRALRNTRDGIDRRGPHTPRDALGSGPTLPRDAAERRFAGAAMCSLTA